MLYVNIEPAYWYLPRGTETKVSETFLYFRIWSAKLESHNLDFVCFAGETKLK